MNVIYKWLLKGNRVEIVSMVISFFLTSIIVLSVNTVLFVTIYWLTGGHFRTAFFVVYLVVSAYLLFLIAKIALDGWQRFLNENPPGN